MESAKLTTRTGGESPHEKGWIEFFICHGSAKQNDFGQGVVKHIPGRYTIWCHVMNQDGWDWVRETFRRKNLCRLSTAHLSSVESEENNGVPTFVFYPLRGREFDPKLPFANDNDLSIVEWAKRNGMYKKMFGPRPVKR